MAPSRDLEGRPSRDWELGEVMEHAGETGLLRAGSHRWDWIVRTHCGASRPLEK